ncbi:hypothetical protein HAX54_027921, partial [Datura stramonium]|nr:hypothetical protein [Datura stramonium]
KGSLFKYFQHLTVKKVLMARKFQPTRGGSQSKNERPEPTHQFQAKSSEFKEEVSSLEGLKYDSDEESGNDAMISMVEETKPIRGDIIKAKTLGFWESLRWQ